MSNISPRYNQITVLRDCLKKNYSNDEINSVLNNHYVLREQHFIELDIKGASEDSFVKLAYYAVNNEFTLDEFMSLIDVKIVRKFLMMRQMSDDLPDSLG
jgi:hypothetical protein